MQGRQGEIKHLFRSFAFLYSRMMLENGGIFVCRTRHLVLAGGAKVGPPLGTRGRNLLNGDSIGPVWASPSTVAVHAIRLDQGDASFLFGFLYQQTSRIS